MPTSFATLLDSMKFLLVLLVTRCALPTKFTSLVPTLLKQATKLIVASQLCFSSSVLASSTQPVYFGVGCFWHVQHEFVDAEKRVLDRTNQYITSTTGYAGSTQMSPDGTVCYHNRQHQGDYGKLGYGEVVQVSIPPDAFQPFAEQYFSLFKNGDRPDRGDVGTEYRSLVGIPGGVKGPLFPVLQQEANKHKLALQEGKGQDADTLGKKMVWVMDSEKYPFRPAEVYHQYHDGFMPGEQYGREYHELRKIALDRGSIRPTNCPEQSIF